MPSMFADHHDSILEEYLHTLESNFLNKDKLVMGKGKNGYVVPTTIYIRVKFLKLKITVIYLKNYYKIVCP